MTGIARRFRSLSPTALLYLAAVTMAGFAVDGGIYTVVFNLYLLRLGLGPEMIGLVNGAAQLTFALMSLPAGALGERYGVRRMLVAGMALMVVGCLGLPLADLLPQQFQLAWLFGGEIVLYFGLALYFVNTAPFLIGVVEPAQRSGVFGLQSALLAVAAFAGGIVGGFLPGVFAGLIGETLASPAPYRFPLLIAGVGLIPALLAIRAARGGDAHADAPAGGDAGHPGEAAPALTLPSAVMLALVMMGAVRLFQVCGLAATTGFFNVYLDRELLVPTAQIGTIAAVARLLSAPAALATPLLTARFGNYRTVIISTIATTLVILPIALIPHWGAAGISLIGVVGLSSIRYASSLVYFMELVPRDRRATVSGVTEMAAGVSFTVMTLAGGYMIAWFGYQSLFLLGAALTLVGTGVFWLAFRRFQRPASAAK
jgi:MFS family permease